MQLRNSLYLPVAATTSNRVRQMDRRNDTAPLNRKCDHCLRSSVRVHFVSARPEVRRFLLAKRILSFIMFFFRCSPENSTVRFRVVFVSFSCRLRV